MLNRGRKRELGLSSVALVSLAKAREQALANREFARTGSDPLAEKRRSLGIPTFAEAARRVAVQKRAGRHSPTHPRTGFAVRRRSTRPTARKHSAAEGGVRGPGRPRRPEVSQRRRVGLGLCAGPELVQEVGPYRHHASAFRQERRAVVGPSVGIPHRVGGPTGAR